MQVEPSKKTTVVNLFAGPGAGKSTFCAGVFASLKWLGVNCEMALEYAKDMVWQQSFDVLNNQLYVFGKQQNRLFRLNGKVDVIITDSPLINSLIYDAQKREQTRAAFVELVLAEHWSYDNLNFFIERRKRYNPIGRLQTKTEAEQLDARIRKVLEARNIPYKALPGVPGQIETIVEAVIAHRPDLNINQSNDVSLEKLYPALLGPTLAPTPGPTNS